MQPGDILFVRTPGVVGGLIRWATRSSVNHVALAIDGERILEVQPETGVQVIQNPYTHYTLGRYYRPLTPNELKTILTTAGGMIGRRYDWSLLWAILFRLFEWKAPWFHNDPCKEICTEAIDVAYLAAGLELIPGIDIDRTPGELMHSASLRYFSVSPELEKAA